MKANSLSICISVPEHLKNKNGFFCNKDCPYCVSKMTGYGETDENTFYGKLNKVRHLAEMCQVNSVIFTGKSEPLLNIDMLKRVSPLFKDFPMEIQTNGLLLTQDNISNLFTHNFDTIAISIDSMKQMEKIFEKVPLIRSFGMTVRLTINLVQDILEAGDVQFYLDLLEENNIDQVSFRSIVIPTSAVNTEESIKAQTWIKNKIDPNRANVFMNSYLKILEERGVKVRDVRTGAWQHAIYMYKGMSCMAFPYCVQDLNSDDDIRSLVYYEDGHLATTWYGSNHGRIF